MSDDVDLVGLYWTTSGPVVVHYGREWSLFDWADRCAAAREVGFAGLGIWHADLEHLLETRTLRELKEIFDDNGLRHLELEFLMDWFLDPGDERRVASDRMRALLLEAAADAGRAPCQGREHPRRAGRAVAAERALRRAVRRGGGAARMRQVVYELMPFDVNVHSIDAALEVVNGTKGGIAIDTWHMSKLGIDPDELHRIPVEQLSWVELSDGFSENMEDVVDETINHRRLPGEGEFDVRAYVEAARDHGYAGPWGVEVLSEELRNNPIDVIFRRAYDATAAQFGHERSSA